VQLGAGQAFLLFPGVWHRYRPLKEIGWTEHFIGFNGEYVDQLMRREFSPAKAVLNLGVSDELLCLMQSVDDMANDEPIGCRHIMAARTLEVLARILRLAAVFSEELHQANVKIEQARYELLRHAGENMDLFELAHGLGMSYSNFRNLFKREIGMSPRQYERGVLINKAKEILCFTDQGVGKIAEQLGFSSVYHFSRFFKNSTGLPPSEWRKDPELRF
jgi:AraC-like DNA-binding protein